MFCDNNIIKMTILLCVKEHLQETYCMMCNFSEFFATGTTGSILQVGIYNSITNYSRLSIVIGFTSSFDEESPVRRCSIHLEVLYR